MKHVKLKIGHGGTLDPLATGVLITGIGSGTKKLTGFLECTKEYEAIVHFGVATDTYDRYGKIVGRAPYDHITKEKVEEALLQFRGNIMQMPPIYSALKVNGKPMYHYAREGLPLPVELKHRPVEVKELDLIEWFEPGSHGYRWPAEEAEKEAVGIAAKVFRLSAVQRSDELSDKTKVNVLEDGIRADSKLESAFNSGIDEAIKDESTPKDIPTSQVEDGTLQNLEEPKVPSKSIGTKRTASDVENVKELKGGEIKKLKLIEGDVSKSAWGASSDDKPSTLLSPTEPQDDGSRAPVAKLRMTVTSGFYVRSLCQDLGVALGSLGIMSELARTRQGDFELGKNVLDFTETMKNEESVWGPKVEELMSRWGQDKGIEKIE